MGEKDTEQALDGQGAVNDGQSDVLLKEADAGRSEFMQAEKERAESLKRGGKSGISVEFGKPILDEDQERKLKDDIKQVLDGKYPEYESPERDNLEILACARIVDPAELKQFREDMERFEARAAGQGLTPEQVAETYEHIARLLDNPTDEPLDQEKRTYIAEQVMSQAATPTIVDQGDHDTCSVASIETRLYTRHPNEVARLVADMATTGIYRASNGTVVDLAELGIDINADHEAENHPLEEEDDRSHASQIFQVTAVNLFYRDQNKGIKYEQVYVPPGKRDEDTGERLWDESGYFPKLIEFSPDLDDGDMVWINNAISGESGKDVYVVHPGMASAPSELLTNATSEANFLEIVARASDSGSLPILVGVHTDNEPFFVDSGGNTAGGSGGAHAVTITAFHPAEAGPPPKPATVEVDNQWGEDEDHLGTKAVSVHDMYLSIMKPDSEERIALLEEDVARDTAENRVNVVKRLELLRAKDYKLTDDEELTAYDMELTQEVTSALAYYQMQRDNHTLDAAEHKHGLRYIKYMIEELPKHKQEAWLVALRKTGETNQDAKWLADRLDV